MPWCSTRSAPGLPRGRLAPGPGFALFREVKRVGGRGISDFQPGFFSRASFFTRPPGPARKSMVAIREFVTGEDLAEREWAWNGPKAAPGAALLVEQYAEETNRPVRCLQRTD